MLEFPSGTKSPFARMIAAEVRARMAAMRMGQRELASEAGFASHNYLAIRLRDERPFTLDDVDLLCVFFDEDPERFVDAAVRNHSEMVYGALTVIRSATEQTNEIQARRERTASPKPRTFAKPVTRAARKPHKPRPGE